MYKIGQIAEMTGVSQDTLRYYEKMGLVTPNTRSESGYRYYDQGTITRIQFIQRAKSVGFTLEGVSELLSLDLNKAEHSCQEVKLLTQAKLAEVERKILELKQIQQALIALNDACCGGSESAEHCSILQTLESGEPVQEKHPC